MQEKDSSRLRIAGNGAIQYQQLRLGRSCETGPSYSTKVEMDLADIVKAKI